MTRRTQTFTNKPATAWNYKDQRITQGKPEELICPEICPESWSWLVDGKKASEQPSKLDARAGRSGTTAERSG